MVRKTVLVAVAAMAMLAGQARAQGEFIAGTVVGGMLFGDNHYGGADATIIYTAPPDKLKGVDPLSVHMVAFPGCFAYNGGGVSIDYDATGASLGEMFHTMMQKQPKKNRTILQVVRAFDPGNVQCAAIWFTYIDQ